MEQSPPGQVLQPPAVTQHRGPLTYLEHHCAMGVRDGEAGRSGEVGRDGDAGVDGGAERNGDADGWG